MKKKIISLALATAMVMGGAMSVSATEITSDTEGIYSSDVTMATDVKVPEIKITVPTENSITLNPYGIAVGDDNKTDKIVMNGTAEDNFTIKNESNVQIGVNATAKATANGDAVLATAALKGTETTKSVFLYLEVKTGAEYAAKYDTKATNQLAFAAKGATKENIVTLAAGDSSATSCEYAILGDCSSTPEKAWTADDNVTLELTWSFTPQLAKPAASN